MTAPNSPSVRGPSDEKVQAVVAVLLAFGAKKHREEAAQKIVAVLDLLYAAEVEQARRGGWQACVEAAASRLDNQCETGDDCQHRAANIVREVGESGEGVPLRPTPIYDGTDFMGFKGGPPHRTVGAHRAWCYDANEWCYPTNPCSLCRGPL